MLGAVWAQSLDGCIGDGATMPWHVPEDLKHFKEVTLGAPVIMGRRTWESLNPRFRPLPGRDNLILSRGMPGPWWQGATVISSLAALDDVALADAWIIGGGQVYAATIGMVDRIEVTLMGANVVDAYGDKAVYAPVIPEDFSVVFETDWLVSEKGHLELPGMPPSELPLKYKFLTYERKDAA
ncbi:dihydrofolate reductase [uncultured Corynebacterium sp.]|uniref:dihydrofolate reductase n=1 Tax=uncultured Corynebacterium sp. TaxID=159447 RepID=UPI0025F43849|nr:dihydrofolate reductase [uncultured Corynebacterium sp.]